MSGLCILFARISKSCDYIHILTSNDNFTRLFLWGIPLSKAGLFTCFVSFLFTSTSYSKSALFSSLSSDFTFFTQVEGKPEPYPCFLILHTIFSALHRDHSLYNMKSESAVPCLFFSLVIFFPDFSFSLSVSGSLSL